MAEEDWLRSNCFGPYPQRCKLNKTKPHDFDSLNAIHIAGTKGKGSTAAFVSSILMRYLPQEQDMSLGQKIGLYTSPHLRFIRERIQINNEPISEEKFAESFFEIWDKLETAQSTSSNKTASQPTKPMYFRYLTLMALHTFLKEKVSTAIIECGIGGEYDSTNILHKPSVTGITSLGIDHVAMLGSTIEEIAWHKAGIMKAGAPAFTAPQPPGAMAVLQSRASEKGVELKVANTHDEIDGGAAVLGLDGDFQQINASLAVEIAASHLRSVGQTKINTERLPAHFLQGLREVRWAGRCETRRERDLTWHIDGGHTSESIQVVGEWFKDQFPSSTAVVSQVIKKRSPPRILLFNQQTRAGVPLLQKLVQAVGSDSPDGIKFTHAIFCTNLTYANSGYKADLVSINANGQAVEDLSVQYELATFWRDLMLDQNERCDVHVVRTIEDAVMTCRKIAQDWNSEDAHSDRPDDKPIVLATGSLHLVGGLLEVLESGIRRL